MISLAELQAIVSLSDRAILSEEEAKDQLWQLALARVEEAERIERRLHT